MDPAPAAPSAESPMNMKVVIAVVVVIVIVVALLYFVFKKKNPTSTLGQAASGGTRPHLDEAESQEDSTPIAALPFRE